MKDENPTKPARTRGRPKGSKGKTKPQQMEGQTPLYNNNIIDNSEDYKSAINFKDQLTVKELKFLEIYLSGEFTQVNALKLAGYEGYDESYLRKLAHKICSKYESQGQDHRKIFRE